MRAPAVLLLALSAVAVTAPARAQAAAGTLGERVAEILRRHSAPGSPATAGIWIGDAHGAEAFTLAADVLRPTASAIKTAYLVELFAACAGHLDRPLELAPQVVASRDHPALAPIPAAAHDEVRTALVDAPVAEVGRIMIHGNGVSNATYNAAANLVTAELGGPEQLSHRLLARWPGRELLVRRYMLARRDHGDNVATPRGLARVLAALARRDVPGLDGRTAEQAARTLHQAHHPRWGAHYSKTGALDSVPPVRVLSGWYESSGRTLVYAVMVTAAGPGFGESASDCGARLKDAATTMLDLLLGELGPRLLWREV